MSMLPSTLEELRGKVVLFVGGGGLSKEPHYRSVRGWGLKTIIVSSPLDSISPDCADVIMVFNDLDDHVHDERNAVAIVALLEARGISPDGVLTVWEDCGPLAARVARLLGLRGLEPDVAVTAKSKFLTQAKLAESAYSDIASLAVKTAQANTPEQMRDALRYIDLPAVIKLEHGSSAAGVAHVRSVEDALNHLEVIANSLRDESDCPGIGLGFGTKVVLSELLIGTEHDVDLVLWEGEVVAAFATDNGATRLPRCSETTAIMPSTATDESHARIVQAAKLACASVGIRSGVINVEMINTSQGVRVIDLNARMGGFYIRDWILRLWNYDLLAAGLCCALGVQPPGCGRPIGWIAGAMILPSVHSAWMSDVANARQLFELVPTCGEIVNVFCRDVQPMEAVDEPFGNIAVWSETPEGALDALCDAWGRWGLRADDPDFTAYLPPLRQ